MAEAEISLWMDELAKLPSPPSVPFSSKDALYFTDPLIPNRHTLAALTLLFDRVFVFMNPCTYLGKPLGEGREGDGKDSALPFIERVRDHWESKSFGESFSPDLASSLYSESSIIFLKETMPLRRAGFFLPISMEIAPKEWKQDIDFILSQMVFHKMKQVDYGKEHPEFKKLFCKSSRFIDEHLLVFHRMFSASIGFSFALANNITPITDNEILLDLALNNFDNLVYESNNPETAMDKYDLFKRHIPSMVALSALKEFVPSIGNLEFDEILEIRERTTAERSVFLEAVNDIVSSHTFSHESDTKKLLESIEKIVRSELLPTARQLAEKIEVERDKLFSKISKQFFVTAPALQLYSQSPIFDQTSLGIALAAYAGKNLADINDHNKKQKRIKSNEKLGGLSFLLEAKKSCAKDGNDFITTTPNYIGMYPRLID